MRKIKKYVIFGVDYGDKEQLEKMEDEINSLIDHGWQPYGSLTPFRNGLAQAVVLYEEEDEAR